MSKNFEFNFSDEGRSRIKYPAYRKSSSLLAIKAHFPTKSTLPEMEFARWLSKSLNEVDFDNDSLSKIESRLTRLVNKFPPLVRDQIKHQHQNLNVSKENNISITAKNDDSNTKPFQDQESGVVKDVPFDGNKRVSELESSKSKQQSPNSAESFPKKDLQKFSAFTSAEQLLKQKEDERTKISSEIEVLSKLIDERDSLSTKQKDLKIRLESAYEEVDKERNKLKDLRKNFDETEVLLNKTTDERDKTIALQKKLSEELSELRIKFEKATADLESERLEYTKSSKEEVEFEIQNFKGGLKQKLRNIFENKRQTDSRPEDERLAKFLRECFTEIENVLNKSGINP